MWLNTLTADLNIPILTNNVASLSKHISDFGNTLVGVVKILTLSRRAGISKETCVPEGESLIILGNGPSLNTTIAEDLPILQDHPCMAVNFAANSDEYIRLKPRYYILADPHFFTSNNPDRNVTHLFERITSLTDWEMTLFIPAEHKDKFHLPSVNTNVTIRTYNCVGVEGFAAFENYIYARGLAMPRPRNILIPALMVGLGLGYKTIYICGVGHSWTRTLSVSEDNKVVTVQPHFYKDNAHEQARVTQVYDNVKLHEILNSFYVAFKSYHTIKRYADTRHINIYNATPGSFIDAFPRRNLSELSITKC